MKSKDSQKKDGLKSLTDIMLAIFLIIIVVMIVTAAQALAIWICVKVGFL